MRDVSASSVEKNGAPSLKTEARVEQRSAASFWQRYFEVYDTLRESIPYRQMIARHVEMLQPTAEDMILDAGTGTGNIAEKLLERGARVTGIDFCDEALEICRQKGLQADFHFGDMTGRLDFADASFDKITCCNVIYTLSPQGQENAVRELFRVLKPGGVAAVTVFGAGFKALKVYTETLRQYRQTASLPETIRYGLRYSLLTVRILYYVGRIKSQEKTGDYTFFTDAEFTALLEGAGFEVQHIEPTLASQCRLALVKKPAAQED